MKPIAAGLALGILGCSAGGTAPGAPSLWTIGSTHADYIVVSDGGGLPGAGTGVMLLRGTWDLEIAPDSSVTGSWNAHWLTPDTLAAVGPQVGTGTLEGRLYPGGSLVVNFNPRYADNNVFVTVGPRGGDVDATWEWSTIGGRASGGPFRVQTVTPSLP